MCYFDDGPTFRLPNVSTELQAASHACGVAAGRVPRLTKDSKGATCTRHDAVQFEPPEAARPPGQQTGGLTARVKS